MAKMVKKAQLGTLVDKYKAFVKKGNDNNAFTKKNLKTADSLRNASVPFGRNKAENLEMEKKRESNIAKADSIEKVVEKRVGVPRRLNLYDTKKMGGMIKRADGSMSKRGLWDNIRANKGSGKKPTSAMLKQEKKIKAQTKKK